MTGFKIEFSNYFFDRVS
jgi:hypothetical protein